MRIKDRAPDFELPDLDGRLHRLSEQRGRIVVLNFWSCECPHAVRTDSLLTRWQEHWGEQVVLLPIASNANETIEALAAVSERRRLPRILVDRQHVVADLYAAVTTPHVFVVDREGRLRYSGAVDDTSFAQRAPARFFLREAVRALLADGSPRLTETQPYGCAIVREALE